MFALGNFISNLQTDRKEKYIKFKSLAKQTKKRKWRIKNRIDVNRK